MYDFKKNEERIIQEGRKYGVKIIVGRDDNTLYMVSDHKGSESVEKYLTRIMSTFNKHVKGANIQRVIDAIHRDTLPLNPENVKKRVHACYPLLYTDKEILEYMHTVYGWNENFCFEV